MNKYCSLFKTGFFSLSLFISINTFADIAYIGDTVAKKVVTRLEGKNLGTLEVNILVDESDRSAKISDYPNWLPATMQSINASKAQMIVLSLGTNDMRLGEYNFPDDATLDAAITEILDNLTPTATVYWVMPHSAAASKRNYYPVQRNAINDAITRAKLSNKYPGLFLVSVDAWAEFYQLKLTDLLSRGKVYFSNDGADLAAEHAVLFGQTFVALKN